MAERKRAARSTQAGSAYLDPSGQKRRATRNGTFVSTNGIFGFRTYCDDERRASRPRRSTGNRR